MSKILSLFERSVGSQDELPPAVVPEDFTGSAPASLRFPDIPVVRCRLQPSCCAIFYTDPLAMGSDRFRLLRMRLRESTKTGRLKTVLITSPLPNDGKSTVAVNLATALSEDSKFKVLLIEADLHRPSLAKQLGVPDWPGLSQCLQGGLPAIEAIRRVEPLGWYLMPAGEAPHNPTELVQTSAFQDLKEAVADYFDWILIDSPPVIPSIDALSLRPHSDATLLVVRAGQTPEDAIEQAIRLLGKRHVAGMVFNGVPGLERAYSKYGYSSPKT
jgi:succinoglycan biosynthesis transport protein ExoP